MKILDRYVGTSIFAASMLVMLVFLGMYVLFGVVGEMERLENNYQVPQALTYIALTIPQIAYILIPFAAMVGCLIGLGSLATNSELVVMRAAGVSINRIIFSAFQPVIILLVISLILGEWVAPYTDQLAKSGKAIAQGNADITKGDDGLGYWHKEGNEVIHFRIIEPDGNLYGITRYVFDEGQELQSTQFVEKASLVDGKWRLYNVGVTEFLGKRTVKHFHDELDWDIQLDQTLLATIVLKPDQLSISGLYNFIDYLDNEGLSSSKYKIAFWKKVTQPVSTLILVFVGISFIFGPLRTVPVGTRVFSGIVMGFSFKLVQDLLGPSSLVFGFPPVMSVVIPNLFCLALGYYLMRKAG